MKVILTLLVLILSGNTYSISSSYTSGKWKIRFRSSFGTNDYSSYKTHLSNTKKDLALSLIIKNGASNFSDHQQRLQYFTNACSSLSELEIIKMAKMASSELLQIYDEKRQDGANDNLIVTPQDQWSALQDRYLNGADTKKGVCRDTSFTVSEILIACGIPKDRISIESFRTIGGGHQVINVLGKNGKTYTINWTELYSTKNNERSNIPNPGLLNTGIVHTRYDAATGKIKDERYTELGNILTAVTKGKVDDPNYQPQLLQLEANNRALTFGLYLSKSSRGDFLKGVSASYEKSPMKWLHISTGMTYAHNSIDFEDYDEKQQHANQHILFFQLFGSIDIPKVQLLKIHNSKLYWENNLEFSSATAGYLTYFESIYSPGFDITLRPLASSGIYYRSGKLETRFKGGVDFGINERLFNSEKAPYFNNGEYPNVYMRGYFHDARLLYKQGRLYWLFNTNTYYHSYGKVHRINASLVDNTNMGFFTMGLLTYSNNLNEKFHFLIFTLKKQWELERKAKIAIGISAQVGMNRDQNGNSIMLNIQYEPSTEN